MKTRFFAAGALIALISINSAWGGARPAPKLMTVNLLEMETTFQKNALKAESDFDGKLVRYETHVATVDRVNGKAHILASTIFDNQILINSDIFIDSSCVKLASELCANDRIQVTGTLASRTVMSKDVVEGSGYSGSVNNGYGGGGSTYVGTRTISWPQYRIVNATIKVVETEAARLDRVNKEQAETDKKNKVIMDAWNKALNGLDQDAAKKAFDLGLDKSYVDKAVLEINKMDPKIDGYDKYVEFYKFLLYSGKADIQKAGAWTLGQNDTWEGIIPARPNLFKFFVESGAVKLDFKFANGDNWLLYFIKEQALFDASKAMNNLKIILDDNAVEFVRLLAENPKCKGLADEKDKYGKTARDYVADDRSGYLDSDGRYTAIRKLILAMK